jgi:two-component system chemotaxis response regulator CheB
MIALADRPAPRGVVAIGCSAGGLSALRVILPSLAEASAHAPGGGAFPWPILVVQHIRQGWRFDGGALFGDVVRAKLPVHEAEDKIAPAPGNVYIAPAGYHLHVEDDRTLALSVDPPVNWARPSIDVTFESVAHAYGGDAIGVVLTGASADGAVGLAAIKRRGGRAVVEDPKTAEVDAMPLAALAATAVDYVVDRTAIGPLLVRLVAGTRQGASA